MSESYESRIDDRAVEAPVSYDRCQNLSTSQHKPEEKLWWGRTR